MQRRPGTGAPCSALDPVGAGRVDRPDWERSSRPSTCPYCPARTRSYPPRISCRSRTPAVRLRSAPKAASARDGRRRICACSTRRRFRFANIQWRDRPSAGPAALSPGESRPVRRQGRAVRGKVPEATRPTGEPWIDPLKHDRDQAEFYSTGTDRAPLLSVISCVNDFRCAPIISLASRRSGSRLDGCRLCSTLSASWRIPMTQQITVRRPLRCGPARFFLISTGAQSSRPESRPRARSRLPAPHASTSKRWR